MEHREPPWRKNVDARDLRDSERRHGWMCTQLETRRRFQMKVPDPLNKRRNGDLAIDWYGSQLSRLFPGCHIDDVVEVLSDGIGFVEPNWSAISANRHDTHGVVKIEGERLEASKKAVKTARAGMAQHFDPRARKFTTQRTIGRDLYEPGLFLVTESTVYFCQASDSGRGARDRACLVAWSPVVGASEVADLPLKVPQEPLTFVQETNANIDSSLRDLTRKVLWPSLLPAQAEPGHCFSLVLIYTSLWQESAGVWALHVACEKSLGPPQLTVPISDLRALVEPAALCLEDVLGWSCEFEGTHRWKRYNVDFLYETLGKERPTWTLDGLASGNTEHAAGPTEKDAQESDKRAYELTVDRLPSESIREVFRQAVAQYVSERYNGGVCPDFKALSTAAREIIRAVDGAVVGVRLDDIALQLAAETGSRQEAEGVSDLPCTASLYLSAVERGLGLADALDTPALHRGRLICGVLTARADELEFEIEKQYCADVIECLGNYLDKLEARRGARVAPLPFVPVS